jgi:hypothetical protein
MPNGLSIRIVTPPNRLETVSWAARKRQTADAESGQDGADVVADVVERDNGGKSPDQCVDTFARDGQELIVEITFD